jgi:hypothetical protein
MLNSDPKTVLGMVAKSVARHIDKWREESLL